MPISASVATTPRTVSSVKRRLDRLAQRRGHEVAPDAGSTWSRRPLASAAARAASGRPRCGQVGDVGVELAPGGVLGVAAGELAERGAGWRPPRRARPAGRRAGRRGARACTTPWRARPGRCRARGRRPAGSAAARPGRSSGRDARRVAGEGRGGDGGAAGVVEPLEHEDREAGAGEVGRGDEAVVAPADHDDVVASSSRRSPAQPTTPFECLVAASPGTSVMVGFDGRVRGAGGRLMSRQRLLVLAGLRWCGRDRLPRGPRCARRRQGDRDLAGRDRDRGGDRGRASLDSARAGDRPAGRGRHDLDRVGRPMAVALGYASAPRRGLVVWRLLAHSGAEHPACSPTPTSGASSGDDAAVGGLVGPRGLW